MVRIESLAVPGWVGPQRAREAGRLEGGLLSTEGTEAWAEQTRCQGQEFSLQNDSDG